MTAASWLAGCCLVAAAVVVAPPNRGRRVRRRLARLTRRDGRSPSPGPAARRLAWHPPLWLVMVACAGGAVGGAALMGGPVAGGAVTAYCLVIARILHRRRADRAAAQSRVRALDALYSLAADLRAGAAFGADSIAGRAGQLGGLVDALRRMADRTGAPLADLLERVAADARATDRIKALAAAQAAGAQATAWLLAALPAAGIALGYGIGADPLRVLLHTPLGAGCTAGAIALQVGGLVWADRIIRLDLPGGPGPLAGTRPVAGRATRLGVLARWLAGWVAR